VSSVEQLGSVEGQDSEKLSWRALDEGGQNRTLRDLSWRTWSSVLNGDI